MADYRTDPDLEFLQILKSEELNDLVYCLTHDKDGALRYTESLTNNPKYKKYYPDHHQYWQDIAGELLLSFLHKKSLLNILSKGC